MEFRKTSVSCEEARNMDIVSYLSSLGYEPAKIRNCDYWYHSPLRNEKTPSFKVNRKLNLWYDRGTGKGGNLIDFGVLYHQSTVGEFLRNLNGGSSFHPPLVSPDITNVANRESKIEILAEGTISSFALERYLIQRRIPIDVARQFCKEVWYTLNDKKYFSIGFKNDAGGYELWNEFYKGSSSPKSITTFENGEKESVVFEGFFDFLSFVAIHKNQQTIKANFVVLNSLSFFEKARPFMEQHEQIKLYLDQDKSGQNYSLYAQSLSSKYADESWLYKNYKDLNDWIMNIGKVQKQSLKPKFR
jgi:hypothetical protein